MVIPIQTIDNTYDLTFSLWVRIRNINRSNPLISVAKNKVAQNYISIFLESVWVEFIKDNFSYKTFQNFNIQVNQWYHVAFV
jgi:hypothetical protein